MCAVNPKLIQVSNAETWVPVQNSNWSDIIVIRTYGDAMDHLRSLKSYTEVTKISSLLHLPDPKWHV